MIAISSTYPICKDALNTSNRDATGNKRKKCTVTGTDPPSDLEFLLHFFEEH